MLARPWLASTLALALGCGATDGGGPGGKADDPGGDGDRARFVTCGDDPFDAPAPIGFHRFLSRVITATGGPTHIAADVVAAPGDAIELAASFRYGALGKHLEGEDVAASIDLCGAWQALGTATTDDDGRVALAPPAGLGPGAYQVRFTVLGDGSSTTAWLWLLPAGSHVVVTDIDGTLTSSDSELWKQLLDGTHVPAAYPAAADLSWAHDGRGWIVVYLTGRPDFLTQTTRTWLDDLGFAPGPVHLARSAAEVLPTTSGVGAYKQRFLDQLTASGIAVDLAYGNATTDLDAYLGAGLTPDQIWIIGPHAGERGSHAVKDDWGPRAAEVDALPTVDQPFVR